MITPSDIADKKFEKAAFGYKTEEVDTFLGDLMVSYQNLFEEKNTLEEKLEVLASKVEEYRASEDSLKTVLVGAQKLGDNIIRDAKAKAEVIISDAQTQMNQIFSDSEAKILSEKEKYQDLQKKTAEFKKQLLSIYKQHLELISLMPEEDANEIKENKEETAEEIVEEVPSNEEMANEASESEEKVEETAVEEVNNALEENELIPTEETVESDEETVLIKENDEPHEEEVVLEIEDNNSSDDKEEEPLLFSID